jgi:acyl dehydratase
MTSPPVGKSYPPTLYAVGREKIKEYARVTGETDPLHLDHEAARAPGHADVVAPPMFAVVYCSPAMGPVYFDPELGIDFSRLVHGGQEFKWGPLVVAGDEITTTVSVTSIEHRAGNGFFVFESVSESQHGHTVCVGTWTNVVRGA